MDQYLKSLNKKQAELFYYLYKWRGNIWFLRIVADIFDPYCLDLRLRESDFICGFLLTDDGKDYVHRRARELAKELDTEDPTERLKYHVWNSEFLSDTMYNKK
jgi:hypothetical protein